MNLPIALQALRVNKLRSGLTMLGIIIGVAAVIVMIAVGSGASAHWAAARAGARRLTRHLRLGEARTTSLEVGIQI
jgi:putative ABC transport system permease protein